MQFFFSRKLLTYLVYKRWDFDIRYNVSEIMFDKI